MHDLNDVFRNSSLYERTSEAFCCKWRLGRRFQKDGISSNDGRKNCVHCGEIRIARREICELHLNNEGK